MKRSTRFDATRDPLSSSRPTHHTKNHTTHPPLDETNHRMKQTNDTETVVYCQPVNEQEKKQLGIVWDIDGTSTAEGDNVHGIVIRPGALEFLVWCRQRGHRLAIWTAASKFWAKMVVDRIHRNCQKNGVCVPLVDRNGGPVRADNLSRRLQRAYRSDGFKMSPVQNESLSGAFQGPSACMGTNSNR